MIEMRNLERSYKTGHTETFVLRRVELKLEAGGVPDDYGTERRG